MQERIGKIRSTMLGFEDHGILTAWIDMDYGGSGQGVGGFAFDTPVEVDGKFSHREGRSFGMEWIRRFLKAAGVDKWEDLAGRTLFVLTDESGDVRGVRPLPTEKGKEFLFDTLIDSMGVNAGV